MDRNPRRPRAIPASQSDQDWDYIPPAQSRALQVNQPSSLGQPGTPQGDALLQLLEMARIAFGPDQLLDLEESDFEKLKVRYQDSDDALIPWRTFLGRVERIRTEREYDHAHRQMRTQNVEAMARLRAAAFDYVSSALEASAFQQGHPTRMGMIDEGFQRALLAHIQDNPRLGAEMAKDQAQSGQQLGHRRALHANQQALAAIDAQSKQAVEMIRLQNEQFKATIALLSGASGKDLAKLVNDFLQAATLVDQQRDAHTPVIDPATAQIDYDELRRRAQYKQKNLELIVERWIRG